MNTDFEQVTVHTATSRGRHPVNADTVAHYRRRKTGVLAVTVVDGIGGDPEVGDEVVDLMPVLAKAAVRTAARDGARSGVLTATHIAAEPLDELPPVDGVMVLAVVPPDEPATVARVGDCRAYGWSDGVLYQLTVDHTYGEELRQHGASESEPPCHDHQVLTSVARVAGRASQGSAGPAAWPDADVPVIDDRPPTGDRVRGRPARTGSAAGYTRLSPRTGTCHHSGSGPVARGRGVSQRCTSRRCPCRTRMTCSPVSPAGRLPQRAPAARIVAASDGSPFALRVSAPACPVVSAQPIC